MTAPQKAPERKNSAMETHGHRDAVGKEHARKTVEKVFQGSSIADKVGDYPKFDKQEVSLGKILGKGGFGTVYEIRSFTLNGIKVEGKAKGFSDDLDETQYASLSDAGDNSQRQTEARLFIAQHCLRNNSDARYALKILSPEVVANQGMFLQGMMDMAMEARFMSDIEHPNIVKIRAMAKCDPFNESYFLVMDRLYDTLERRIQKVWLPKSKRQTSFFGKNVFDRKGEKKDALFEERIVYAFDLSAAINYLHQRKILYRDLKPENIGFDIRDDIKLFDFGLAKELRDDLKVNDKFYNLTADTGSPRYMAPEVALGKPYNGTCDTYSFSLLLWQMLALQTPYEVYTIKKLKERVWSKMEKRPLVDESWSASVKLLLKKGWAGDPNERFEMHQVEAILKKECIRVRDGNSDGLEHQRRRSTFVFRAKDDKKGKSIDATRKSILQQANSSNKDKKGAKSVRSLNENIISVDA